MNSKTFAIFGYSPATIAAFISALAAIYFLARTVGQLVGESGPDPGVLAAVLPVILSSMSGFIFVKIYSSRHNGNHHHQERLFTIGLMIILFCAALLHHTYASVERRIAGQAIDAEAYLTKRIEYLKACSTVQAQLNQGRMLLQLPPLEFERVCPNL